MANSNTDTSAKIACSVGILTRNSERGLRRALESLRDFDEIILCDGGSTDKTLEIAQEFGCKVISDDPKFKDLNGKLANYAGARNQTLDASKHPWFFFIDSDEYVSKELVAEIRGIVARNSKPAAYWLPRKYLMGTTVIECASTYPNKQMRFFHKDAVLRFVRAAHEKIVVRQGFESLTLKNIMLVPLEDISSLKKKWDFVVDLEIRSKEKITFVEWLRCLRQNSKVSLLFAFRFVRNLIFCRGPRMPFAYEWERHVHHFKLVRAFYNHRK